MSINKREHKEDVVHTHTEILLNHKKKLALAATWMDLEGIMLSEISMTKTNTV